MLPAPEAAWQSASCSYGLVVAVLQACEQVLRQAALHRSGDQIQQLIHQFLRLRRSTALEGDAPEHRPAQVEQLPRSGRPRKRRSLPKLNTY